MSLRERLEAYIHELENPEYLERPVHRRPRGVAHRMSVQIKNEHIRRLREILEPPVCHCGNLVEDHGPLDNHQPVEMERPKKSQTAGYWDAIRGRGSEEESGTGGGEEG